ncbi:Crp/Fnr family transcriptional regulator [Magnetospirillum sp. 64-120]|uniref:Crp/Fnr family transcriptional regulator n=1 Tax=Magnetospirillum sp. 64-120 TaxID=1895778 RepID=UPI0025BFB861|nr:Crp/Fnr family transcriptional regulator [Magnetospirillum sp. 64-120]
MVAWFDTCGFNDFHSGTAASHLRETPQRQKNCPFHNASTPFHFERDGFLFHQGDEVRAAIHLSAGLVALERVDEDGKLVVLKVLRPPALFPCADLFAEVPHASTARALTDGHGCLIPAEQILSSMDDPATRSLLLKCSAAEARDSEDAVFRLCSGDLSEQVMAALSLVIEEQRADDGAIHGVLPLCWRDVAAMVGTSPEVMSRTLRKLEDKGRLKVKGRAVTLNPRRGGGQGRVLNR